MKIVFHFHKEMKLFSEQPHGTPVLFCYHGILLSQKMYCINYFVNASIQKAVSVFIAFIIRLKSNYPSIRHFYHPQVNACILNIVLSPAIFQ